MTILTLLLLFAVNQAVVDSRLPIAIGSHVHHNKGPHGHKWCHSKLPVLSSLNESRFEGLWYLDSSTSRFWSHDTCNVYRFRWHPHEFTHNNHTYPGHFTYLLRRNWRTGFGCWPFCSFSLAGYLHGWSGKDHKRLCDFGNTTKLNDKNASPIDPCHPHYKNHWSFWAAKTDYDSYALVWLCSDHYPYVLLLSRSAQPLSTRTRQMIDKYLAAHNVHVNMRISNNEKCSE